VVAPSYAVEGRRVALPVEVRDARCGSASFLVPAAAARRLMAQPALELAEPFPGRALLSIAGIEYRDNDLGTYNELAIAFLVRQGDRRPLPLIGTTLDFMRGRLAAYIHRLPVTTAFSCAAGRDIWGFPKFVADVAFTDEQNRRTCTLKVDGDLVLSLTLRRGGRFRFRDARLDAVAVHGLQRTPFVSSGTGVGFRLGGATLTLGTHSLADELRALGLPRRALTTSWIEHMRATFHAPVPVARGSQPH
jgi:hypothetical protein